MEPPDTPERFRRRQGLDRSAAYIHDLKAATREPVDLAPKTIEASEQLVGDTVRRLRSQDFQARPGNPCSRCDVHARRQWDFAA
jgi:hypothetical protein